MCVRSNTTLVRLAPLILLLAGCRKGAGMDTDTPDPVTEIEHCGSITGSETWSAEVLHRLTCDVVVEGSLTLDPGVEVYAEQGTALRVHGGSLDARGTSDEPVLFASAESFPVAGDWVGIEAQEGDLALAFATVRHAGSEGALVQLVGGAASISNVILTNSDLHGLYAEGTEFSLLEELEFAYVEEPLTIPWAGAAVLSGVVLDQVDGAAVRLLGETLDVPVGLADIGVPYLCEGVTVLDGANLWIEGGAMLATSGDITVQSGAAMVMRGDSGNTAALLGWEGASFTVFIEQGASMADFRWASIAGGGVWSAAEDLSFRYSEITGAPGAALDIEGTVDEAVTGQLSGNSFSGEGPGLVVRLGQLDSVGENDYSGSSFDGVVVRGESFDRDVGISSWPSATILVQGDLISVGGTLTLSGPATLGFADGTALTVDGGALDATNMSFTHLDEVSGGWEGITVVASANNTLLTACDVAYGGGWEGANLTLLDEARVHDNTLRRSAGWGVWLEPGVSADLRDNSYEGNARGDVGP
jgi:hypothetical protein